MNHSRAGPLRVVGKAFRRLRLERCTGQYG